MDIEVDFVTGQPLSEEFLSARAATWAAAEQLNALRRRDCFAPSEDVEQAEAEHWQLAEACYEILDADRRKAEVRDARDRMAAAQFAPMEQAINRVVILLRQDGPLTASEIEARRVPGLSKNVVRPVLREAVDRELVERVQVGKRVLWSIHDTEECFP